MKIQQDTLLGLVFFGVLAGLGWATMKLTSLSFEEKPTRVVYFDDALGLREGDPVFVLGKRFGEVAEVALTRANEKPPIRVVLALDGEVDLTEGMTVEIRDSSLLGGKQVNIDPGVGIPRARDEELRGDAKLSALDALGEANLTGMVNSIKNFFDRLGSSEGSVGALLESRELFEDFAATIKSARRSIEEVERGDGPLGRIIYSREMADDLAAVMRDLRQITDKVNTGKGPLARILNDEALAADLVGAVEDLKALTGAARRGEGLVGRMLADEEFAEKFETTVESLRSAVAKLDDPESGLVGALLGDPQLRDDGRMLVANLSEASRKINEGDGVLGRLVNDEELGQKLDRLMTQVTGAIEDAREAAPVSTFFQVIAAPF